MDVEDITELLRRTLRMNLPGVEAVSRIDDEPATIAVEMRDGSRFFIVVEPA